MSFGTSVILLLNLDETYIEYEENDEIFFDEIESEALNNVNKWLQDNHSGQLVDLDDAAYKAGDRPMLSLVFGGAFNGLMDEDFVNVVRAQKWRSPENVQILTKWETEQRYTLHTLDDVHDPA